MSELLKSILYHNPEFRKQVSDSPLMRAKIQMAEQRLRIDIAKLFIELGEPPLGDDIENR